MSSSHFEDKDPLSHVLEKKEEGLLAFESHGLELPDHFSSAADASRDTAAAFLFLALSLFLFSISSSIMVKILIGFCISWVIWKGGRSAWLSWSRLERLHRTIEQEKYEIEHNRSQEKEELTALYRAKGLEGKLLEDVISVLMADEDRLLKVMLEEELGISLQTQEHPLKIGLWTLTGAAVSCILCFIGFIIQPFYGTLIASLTVMGGASVLSARQEKNELIPAAIWIMALGCLAFGVMYFVVKMMLP